MSTAKPSFDVTVVGAGPAGSAAALGLRRRGLSVLVVESRPGPAWRIGETLPSAARPLLDSLGILEGFESDGHLPSYGNCSAWGTEEIVVSDFIFGPHGNGWQLDRERFDARLAGAAKDAGTCLWYGCRLLAVGRADTHWDLEIAAGPHRRAARTRWLVDATGRQSTLARQMGARRTTVDALLCVYANAISDASGRPTDEDTRTLIESAPEGWWYTALTPGGRRTVAWLTDPDLLRRHPWRGAAWLSSRADGAPHFRSLLNRHGYEFIETPRCTSASSSRVEPWCGPNWLAVGDAALAFDPLSSQGLLNALYTGMRGAEAVASANAGNRMALKQYSNVLADIWAGYLRNRLAYYRMERRWARWPFWSRRHRPSHRE